MKLFLLLLFLKFSIIRACYDDHGDWWTSDSAMSFWNAMWISVYEYNLLPFACTYTDYSTLATEPTIPPIHCQQDDIILNSRCYSFNRDELSQSDARAQCEMQGKTLAIFDNFSQIQFISSYASSKFATTYASFWIGLQRDSSSSSFYWPDGTSAVLTNWSPGYPFDGQLFVAQEISSGKWKTLSAEQQLFSVCSGIVS
ncbi:unnamed protein product [Caenorhabditis angaria]|uniref:C-type lectin domain-containing protein n=1 Tax=Caenorhabditis angaria TaxID=860376 RepID=A0A9P1N4M1_9PELO|nr:unnamed protein product [Caenorhabditis angaria]